MIGCVKRKVLGIAAGVALGLVLAAGGLLWSWTRTPHGRMDLGAALVVRAMGSQRIEFSPEARARANAWTARFIGEPPEGVAIEDSSFEGPAGPLPARLYRPSSGAPIGLVVWIHGGGFWMGDELSMWDGTCGRLAEDAGVLVASIGYRLAPEHPFPAAVEDSWAGLGWAAGQAPAWGIDPGRIAVMGGSAGGNLAAVTALRARDEGGPPLALQVLVVPTLNAGGAPTESMRAFSRGYGLDGIDAMRSAYFGSPEATRQPWATPLLAERLDGLPPALIHTAQFDPLRDEGERYAARLRAAGVPVELHRFDGTIHGFLGSPDATAESERRVAAALRQAFVRGSSTPEGER